MFFQRASKKVSRLLPTLSHQLISINSSWSAHLDQLIFLFRIFYFLTSAWIASILTLVFASAEQGPSRQQARPWLTLTSFSFQDLAFEICYFVLQLAPWLSWPPFLFWPQSGSHIGLVLFLLPCSAHTSASSKLPDASDPLPLPKLRWIHIRNCVGCASAAELQSHRRILALGLTERFTRFFLEVLYKVVELIKTVMNIWGWTVVTIAAGWTFVDPSSNLGAIKIKNSLWQWHIFISRCLCRWRRWVTLIVGSDTVVDLCWVDGVNGSNVEIEREKSLTVVISRLSERRAGYVSYLNLFF